MQMGHLESVIGFQRQRFSGVGVSDPAHWVAILDVFQTWFWDFSSVMGKNLHWTVSLFCLCETCNTSTNTTHSCSSHNALHSV